MPNLTMMNIDLRLKKNITWTVTSRFGILLLTVISNVILARYFGVKSFGEYTFVTSMVMIGNAFTTFGTDMVLIRRISAEKDIADLSTALLIQLVASSLFIVCVFVFYRLFPISSALLVYVFALIPLSFFTTCTIALRGAREMKSFSVLHFGVAVFQLCAIFILISLQGNVFQLSFLLLVVQILCALLGIFFYSIKIGGISNLFVFSRHRVLPLMRSSLQLALIGTFRLIYEKITLALLPVFAGVYTTGLFSASARVLDAAKLGYMASMTAIYPEMAHDKKFALDQLGYRPLFLSSVALSFLLFVFAKPITFFVFGSEYISSVTSLRILAWILPCYFLVSYYSLAFVALGLDGPVLISLFASVFLLAVFLFPLSKNYGLSGVAALILFAELFQAGLLWLQWRKYVLSQST